MNKLLTGKVAVAAGPSVNILSAVVQRLLQEDATVIVPAGSAGEIAMLKASLATIDTGKLVTLLTDFPDYDKVFEIAQSITEQFGSLDLAIICFDTVAATDTCNIIETEIVDWEKMMDNNITAFFIGARVLLGSMKQYNKGLFVSVTNYVDFENKNCPVLVGLISCMQKEMAKLFSKEAKSINVSYCHLCINDNTGDRIRSPSPNDEMKFSDDSIGDFIMNLYHDNRDERPFQNLQIAAQITNRESIE